MKSYLYRLGALVAVGVSVITIAACGFDTAAAACQDAGTKLDTSAKVYSDDDGQETRCADGREVENEGNGWYVED